MQMISAEAPVLFAKAAEIFVTELTLRAWIHAEDNKRRTLQVCLLLTTLLVDFCKRGLRTMVADVFCIVSTKLLIFFCTKISSSHSEMTVLYFSTYRGYLPAAASQCRVADSRCGRCGIVWWEVSVGEPYGCTVPWAYVNTSPGVVWMSVSCQITTPSLLVLFSLILTKRGTLVCLPVCKKLWNRVWKFWF